MIPVHIRNVSNIQLARGVGVQASRHRACRKPTYRTIRSGGRSMVRFGPTTVAVAPGYATGCGVPTEAVAIKSRCVPPPAVSRTDVEVVAAGTAEGLKRAPISASSPAPWSSAHAYRNKRFPRNVIAVLSTFAATDTRTIQVRNALRGYLGANAPVSVITLVPGTPAAVLTFQAPDNYVADELIISCQSMAIATQVQWSVAVNGDPKTGPHPTINGKLELSTQALRGQTIAVNAILRSTDAFAVGAEILINGWTFPSINSTDGTFSKTLRASPSWPRERWSKQ